MGVEVKKRYEKVDIFIYLPFYIYMTCVTVITLYLNILSTDQENN